MNSLGCVHNNMCHRSFIRICVVFSCRVYETSSACTPARISCLCSHIGSFGHILPKAFHQEAQLAAGSLQKVRRLLLTHSRSPVRRIFPVKWMSESSLIVCIPQDTASFMKYSCLYKLQKGKLREIWGGYRLLWGMWINTGEPEGVNKYLTGHLGSFNQWGGSGSLHTIWSCQYSSLFLYKCVSRGVRASV